MNTLELLERVKTRLGVDTDYKLAKKLEIDDGLISYYRSGKRTPNNYAIAKFAKVLEVDPWTLVKELEAQTEKNPKRREFWSKAATLFFFVVILNMSPAPSEAAPMAKSLIEQCILCQIARMRKWLKKVLLQTAQMSIPKAPLCCLIPRVNHMPA